MLALLLCARLLCATGLHKGTRYGQRPAHRLFHQQSSVEDTKSESTHMKLNQQSTDQAPSPPPAEEPESWWAVLTEVVVLSTNETLFACEGKLEASRDRLEYFGHHRDGQFNLSTQLAANEVQLVERTYDLRSADVVQQLTSRFQGERILSSSRDFPPASAHLGGSVPGQNEAQDLSQFESKLRRHIMRVLAVPTTEEDTAVLAFLRQPATDPAAEGQSWSEFIPSRRAHIQSLLVDPAARMQEEVALLKSFLVHFRQQLPYYYSACLLSGCGCKENNAYLGYSAPRPHERAHRAAVCELVLCATCHRVSRFPRFNALGKILEERRGRCGEYSILLLRLAELLGYRARLVVDWDDHMWVEVEMGLHTGAVTRAGAETGAGAGIGAETGTGAGTRWVHADPCEASVDEPLIYQGWGKNATYVFSIAMPSRIHGLGASASSSIESSGSGSGSGTEGGAMEKLVGLVEIDDVTHLYTEAGSEEIERRRVQRGVNSSGVAAALEAARARHRVAGATV